MGCGWRPPTSWMTLTAQLLSAASHGSRRPWALHAGGFPGGGGVLPKVMAACYPMTFRHGQHRGCTPPDRGKPPMETTPQSEFQPGRLSATGELAKEKSRRPGGASSEARLLSRTTPGVPFWPHLGVIPKKFHRIALGRIGRSYDKLPCEPSDASRRQTHASAARMGST